MYLKSLQFPCIGLNVPEKYCPIFFFPDFSLFPHKGAAVETFIHSVWLSGQKIYYLTIVSCITVLHLKKQSTILL